MNGSSRIGNCSLEQNSVCFNPTSSVLLDGVVPEFIDKEDDMWARDLLTLQSTTNVGIEFRFNDLPENTGVGRTEVVLFQCPQCGIYVDSISIISTTNVVVGSRNISLSSCDSLVRVCIEVNDQGSLSSLFVNFTIANLTNATIVQPYIAEVTFYNSSNTSSVCPVAEEIITTEIVLTTDETTTTTDEMTTDSAMNSEAFIILTSIAATLATVINYTTDFSMP